MQLIKVHKKTNGKIEQAKVIIGIYCMLSDIKLSDSELTVLAYFSIYKDNSKVKDFIVKSGLLNDYSLKNTISKLKRSGLLKKSSLNKEYLVSEKLSFNPEPVIGFIIKIDNR